MVGGCAGDSGRPDADTTTDVIDADRDSDVDSRDSGDGEVDRGDADLDERTDGDHDITPDADVSPGPMDLSLAVESVWVFPLVPALTRI